MKGNPATAAGVKLNDPFNYAAWADESFKLAQEYGLQRNAEWREDRAPTYNAASTKVVRKRVAWGGYRLAALLNSIWP